MTRLSSRQLQVLGYVAQGWTNPRAVIANRM